MASSALITLPTKRAELPLALYLHFPWCLHKCSYCDFNSRALTIGDHPKIEAYVKQLCRDLAYDAEPYAGTKLVSVYFGGGTPSLLPPSALAEILRQIKQFFVIDEACEITLEANPGTINLAYCEALVELGINRVSLGAQSFQNAILAQIERIHTAEQIESAVKMLRKAGISKLNLDLIFGLPHHTKVNVLDDLKRALTLLITHLSWYQLTLEEFKHYAAIYQKRPLGDELSEIQETGERFLLSQGFQHYEVAAFARDASDYCKHNLNYWTFGDYLGIGAGAHGKITGADYQVVRTVKWDNPDAYLSADNFYAEFKEVSVAELPFEFMLNALRLYRPLSYQLFYERTGLQIKVLENQLKQAERLGFLQRRRDDLIVTPHGKNFLNDLLELFL